MRLYIIAKLFIAEGDFEILLSWHNSIKAKFLSIDNDFKRI